MRCRNIHPDDKLTPRQQEAVLLAKEGFTDIQIGRIMHISSRTVENHLSDARERLGCTGRHGVRVFEGFEG